ncbi:CFEM domain-containing protein [Colletotrichum graminicola M1.001]|uniref:CFEM domain-containing protein n=1 Tax=Colletotrichum graminicola (strain M1.001 / M2 / FGSC 10212) TaxID=645133 RepID=E3Q7P7_COLGM|nr:CFEM domain-containing protein [Colletotrichum graminicola M1.001]EFQ26909.1 CFEM domain-containing protein [Colletotrichum graminicola M1.001]
MSVWGHDDTTALVAFVLILVVFVQSFYLIDIGFGREVWTLHDYEITAFLKHFLVLRFIYLAGLALIKASILFLFLKIFPGRRFRQCLWAVQIFNLLVCMTFFFVCFFQCRPFSYFWTGWDGEHEGVCIDVDKSGLIHVALNITLDIIMLVLPVTQIYKLQMNKRKKIGVIAMFQAGIFLTIVSILRIKSLSSFAISIDLTADSVPVSLWAYVELGVGLAVACMPSAWQLLKMITSKVTQLTTTVATNITSSKTRKSPSSMEFPDKSVKMSIVETQSYRSNSIAVASASSPKRHSDHDEWKVGQAL